MFGNFFKKKSEQPVGEVVHFFDRLQVAVVRLSNSLRVGDKIKIKRGAEEFTDVLASMQVDHIGVDSGRKGEEVAILLSRPTKAGALVYRI